MERFRKLSTEAAAGLFLAVALAFVSLVCPPQAQAAQDSYQTVVTVEAISYGLIVDDHGSAQAGDVTYTGENHPAAFAGTPVIVTAYPDSGYYAEFTVTGADEADVTINGDVLTIAHINKDTVITVTFKRNPLPPTADGAAPGLAGAACLALVAVAGAVALRRKGDEF